MRNLQEWVLQLKSSDREAAVPWEKKEKKKMFEQ